jgi:hypothetical protein
MKICKLLDMELGKAKNSVRSSFYSYPTEQPTFCLIAPSVAGEWWNEAAGTLIQCW